MRRGHSGRSGDEPGHSSKHQEQTTHGDPLSKPRRGDCRDALDAPTLLDADRIAPLCASDYERATADRPLAVHGRSSQNVRFESIRIVTGPSLTSATAMSAPKTPLSTGRPLARNAAATRS